MRFWNFEIMFGVNMRDAVVAVVVDVVPAVTRSDDDAPFMLVAGSSFILL